MIKLLKADNTEVEFSRWVFPGGEVGVKLPELDPSLHYLVYVLNPNSEDLFVFFNLIDALRNAKVGKSRIQVLMPYIPYARQDRVCHPGESHGLSTFAKQLRADPWWSSLTVVDPHSPASIAYLNSSFYELRVISQGEAAANLPQYDYLIAPDQGASKKLGEHEQVASGKALQLFLNKTRINSTVKHEPLHDNIIVGTACIVDDICDGGATFLSVGNMLRKNQPRMTKLDLYVTHGLFSKGTHELDQLFDNVYTAYNFNPKATSVKVI